MSLEMQLNRAIRSRMPPEPGGPGRTRWKKGRSSVAVGSSLSGPPKKLLNFIIGRKKPAVKNESTQQGDDGTGIQAGQPGVTCPAA
ncbi:hypothetical protein LINGRAHAP2_LOCUS32184 [Linum grandiflorum]